jgi:4'-phosphopantetheinyl transferase
MRYPKGARLGLAVLARMSMDRTPPISVDVWLWSLDVAPARLEQMTAFLSVEEIARANRFHRPIHRDRWIAARAGLRELLSQHLGVGPGSLAFATEAHGRPVLAGPGGEGLSFNLSHSEGVGALAISASTRVGVDIEFIRPISDQDIAWALSPAERQEMDAFGLDQRGGAFFRYWTLKEAIMKGTGLGSLLPLHDFDVSLSGPRLKRLPVACDAPDRWRMAETAPIAGLRGALAARTEGCDLLASWRWAFAEGPKT